MGSLVKSRKGSLVLLLAQYACAQIVHDKQKYTYYEVTKYHVIFCYLWPWHLFLKLNSAPINAAVLTASNNHFCNSQDGGRLSVSPFGHIPCATQDILQALFWGKTITCLSITYKPFKVVGMGSQENTKSNLK